ncbi:hypothetical protein E1176_04645 [Fulvivirga sp. RKSG066]|nr:hypothetical protein [Fulvivirga aurantia]
MKKEEEKFDELLKSMMREGELSNPPSNNFTQETMLNIAAWKSKKQRIEKRLALLLMAAGGLGIILVSLLIAWSNGWLAYAGVKLTGILSPLLALLPFDVPPVFLVLLVLHFVLIRAIFAAFLINKSYFNIGKFRLG